MRTFRFEKEKYGFELQMDLHKFENNPDIYFEKRLHSTDFFEIFIFENASGHIELNNFILDIKKRSFFFISPFQKKSCDIDTTKIKGFHLVFQNDFLTNFFNDKLFVYKLQFFHNIRYPQYLQIPEEEYDKIQYILNEIICEIKNFQSDSLHIIRSLLYFYLSKLNRLYVLEYNLTYETKDQSIAYKFKEMLELNVRKFHSVEEYSQNLNISRQQLNKICKDYFGYTSKETISNRILQEIKIELRYSNKTISEIASSLNFSEANNLTRFFKKIEGVTPRKYRLNYQNDRNSI